MAPSSKSPLEEVATAPEFGEALMAWAAATASREFAVAMPEYSKMANRSVAERLSETVTVLGPAAMFSA